MMSTEISSLVWISTFTALLWAPYVLNRMIVGGIQATVSYPAEPPELSPWARRLRAAHSNAVENLGIFAALIFAAQSVGATSELTASAATLFVWSRVVHAVTYTLGIPWIRTLAFVGGFAAQMMIAVQLLAH